MYKAAVRWLVRRNISRLNRRDYGPLLAMFADDAEMAFPGDNSWARQHRPVGDRPSHQGRSEIEAFVQRFVDEGVQMEIDDILVNGPPWNTRIAVRVHDWIHDERGNEVYANRAVLWAESRWGKIRRQEDYEDTQRVAAYDERIAT